MAEAFCFMHAHCTSLPLEQQVTATRVLLPRLLQWAYDHNSAAAPHLHKLLELPFGQQGVWVCTRTAARTAPSTRLIPNPGRDDCWLIGTANAKQTPTYRTLVADMAPYCSVHNKHLTAH